MLLFEPAKPKACLSSLGVSRASFYPLSKGYVIYSVGADGHDDGGREPPEIKKFNDQSSYDITLIVEKQAGCSLKFNCLPIRKPGERGAGWMVG